MSDADEPAGPFACLLNCWRRWRQREELRRRADFLQAGARFKRRTFTFGFGTGSERVEVKLKDCSTSVLTWRKETSEEAGQSAWHEIDFNDVKTVDAKGRASFVVTSRTGDLLLELEASATDTRDDWVHAMSVLLDDFRLHPQARVAHKSVKDRVKEQAQKQRHFAKRTVEMQQQKRKAEERKSHYLKDTGGMQYTAIAMANRK